ncbi:conjugative transfer protein TrbH [Nitrosomonas nitrosa]|uniref:conjugal transfer protein TrbH n=1 Tax=Nitrosomonas nitrosa TaxID=52442 RepID=UPI000D327519|nr:conjugal transfer protein TrbH [Nitrosomonas nitrosa]PTQ91934.1 conjugative transfer protein TrbH [Nitrosomonas nitrosa]
MRLRFNAVKTDNYFAYKPVLICAAILLLLGGCAMTQPYGNFIQNPSPAFSQYGKVMADDVTDQIGRLYPAASTQFAVQHPASDPFGQALIDNLRMQGYAVQETVKQDNPLLAVVLSQKIDEADEYAQQTTQAEAKPSLALRYIIDRSDDLYHVSILIEDLKLTRAFVVHSGQIEPAGLWVRRLREN